MKRCFSGMTLNWKRLILPTIHTQCPQVTSVFFIIRQAYLLFFLIYVQISTVNAKNVDPSQTSHSVASDLYLHCLQKDMLGSNVIK